MSGLPARRPSDPRADDLRRRYHGAFTAPEIPVPVDAIATDLLGLWIEEVDDLPVSGALIPGERLILLNRRESKESPERRRFTVAHEIGHWVCQCQEGRSPAPWIMCRGADIDAHEGRSLESEANDFAATLLMPEAAVGRYDVRSLGVSTVAFAWRRFNLGMSAAPPGR